ncbi:hypothetical protein ACIBCT_31480 [Streptosporangium sp. NPDC050855]|uniref:hypothetical protein n=1 Tax=Streptosporangium sp. NPDC050855 TaxID=3366194 RepID=UPI00379CB31F
MADDTDDTTVVSFRPRSNKTLPPPPPLPSVPRPSTSDDPAVGEAPFDGEETVPVGAMPNLPSPTGMSVPFALMMPPVPPLAAPPNASAADGSEAEDAFSPPPAEDPGNPTGREVAATAMALMTALGVAAAQGMWHRARHRQALADQARAGADKAASKAAAASPGGTKSTKSAGTSGGSGSLLRSPAGGGTKKPKGSRAFARRSHDNGGNDKPPKRPKTKPRRASRGPHDRPPAKPSGKGGAGSKGPKAVRGGKAGWWKRRATPKGSKDSHRKKATGAKLTKAIEDKNSAKKPKGSKGDKTPGAGRLTWRAPKGGGKEGRKAAARPKRWAGRTDATGKGTRPQDRPGKRRNKRSGKKAADPKRPTAWRWRTWKARFGKADEGKATRDAKNSQNSKRAGKGNTRGTKHGWWKRRTKTSSGENSRSTQGGARRQRTAPPPPPGWEGMRPPPGADRTVHVAVERVDDRPWPRPEAPAITVGQAALTAGPAVPPAARSASSPRSAPDQQGAPIVSMPVKTTQYADADLTIYDVIEADADMAEEITDGVADARATADGCEQLMTRLEDLYAEISDLKVPGVLLGMMAMIMDKTQTVKARAEAIAANLPAAAEAISVAGTNAADRHKGLADAVRDAGHIRPAERQYHDE